MSDLYYSVRIANARTLCIGAVTQREVEGAVLRPKRSDETALYLYEMNAGDLNAEIKILARFVSEDAAIRLGRSLSERFGNAETDDLVPA
jgi:hypothetical protein